MQPSVAQCSLTMFPERGGLVLPVCQLLLRFPPQGPRASETLIGPCTWQETDSRSGRPDSRTGADSRAEGFRDFQVSAFYVPLGGVCESRGRSMRFRRARIRVNLHVSESAGRSARNCGARKPTVDLPRRTRRTFHEPVFPKYFCRSP